MASVFIGKGCFGLWFFYGAQKNFFQTTAKRPPIAIFSVHNFSIRIFTQFSSAMCINLAGTGILKCWIPRGGGVWWVGSPDLSVGLSESPHPWRGFSSIFSAEPKIFWHQNCHQKVGSQDRPPPQGVVPPGWVGVCDSPTSPPPVIKKRYMGRHGQ